MTATRRAPPTVDIYQDPHPTSYNHTEVSQAEARLLTALGPVVDVSAIDHTLLIAPTEKALGSSPRKSSPQHSSSPPPFCLTEADFNTMAPPAPAPITDSMPKKKPAHKRKATLSSNAPDTTNFLQLESPFDQENLPPSLSQTNHFYVDQKPSLQRSLTDAAALRKQPMNKQKIEEDVPCEIPEPEDMPSVADPGCKPEHSYATMIGMALLRAPNRRLTLAHIYKWISQTFSHYQLQDSGWQNSIRHNLSLNKNFVKHARPKEDTGKGHYWMIVPGQEHLFLKDKTRGRANTMSAPGPATHDFIVPPTSLSSSFVTVPSSHTKNLVSESLHEETEIHSDETVACSDPAIHDGVQESEMPPPSRTLRSSPPPEVDIRSSPPAPPSRHSRADTPPRFVGSGRSGTRKRKLAGLGDSGYYSSIESSAIKAHAIGGALPTSEADFNPGRAEFEIFRMRSSPRNRSPTKNGPPHKKARSTSMLPSSSPFVARNANIGILKTPPKVFTQPVKPPPSVSPNTNLRNHRNKVSAMFATPDHSNVLSFANSLGSTPQLAWMLPEEPPFDFYTNDSNFPDTFDVFADTEIPFSERGSPEKKSDKRPGLGRTQSFTDALADITGNKVNSRILSSPLKMIKEYITFPDEGKTPLLKQPHKTPARMHSPLKSSSLRSALRSLTDENTIPPTGTPGFTALPDGFDVLGASYNFPASTVKYSASNVLPSDGSEEGFDMLQSFPKIGAPTIVAANGSPVKQTRPSFPRSNTSMW